MNPAPLHKLKATLIALAACTATLGTQAQVWSTHPAATATVEAARAQMDADRKLCAQEATPELRLQCRRDAQAVYDRAVGANTPSAGTYRSEAAKPAVACPDCGRVSAVRVEDQAGTSDAVGLIVGGVAGAALGHQVGGGFGKDLATIAGAAGGAYAGKKVQESMNAKKVWVVSAHMQDGRDVHVRFNSDPGYAVGDAVKLQNNTLIRP